MSAQGEAQVPAHLNSLPNTSTLPVMSSGGYQPNTHSLFWEAFFLFF